MLTYSTRSRRLPGLLALVLPGSALAATATSRTDASVDWRDTLKAAGYREAHRPVTGVLIRGESIRWAFDVSGGSSYVLVAICDQDCDDLDLRVYDETGREIGRDTENDDVPAVIIDVPDSTSYSVTGGHDETLVLARTPASQRYSVAVKMIRCSLNPCHYQLNVFRRGSPTNEGDSLGRIHRIGPRLSASSAAPDTR